MGKIQERSEWVDEVYSIDMTTPVLGGEPEWQGKVPTAGFANAGIQQLSNRTQYLREQQQQSGTDIDALETKVENNQALAALHYNSTSGHPNATTTASGFMSAKDKTKLNNLATVATTANYDDLVNTPFLGYFIRVTDFEAHCGYKYYIKENCSVTLSDPAEFGWVDGDFIVLNKSPDAAAFIFASPGSTILTASGTDTTVEYDVYDEIFIYFDGTNWRI